VLRLLLAVTVMVGQPERMAWWSSQSGSFGRDPRGGLCLLLLASYRAAVLRFHSAYGISTTLFGRARTTGDGSDLNT